MMQISQEQIAALAEPMARAYQQELVRDFQRQHPRRSTDLGKTRLREIVRPSVGRAHAVGVSSSGALLRSVSLAVLVHPEFDHAPEVQARMRAPGMDADDKVHLLSDIFIAALDKGWRPGHRHWRRHRQGL